MDKDSREAQLGFFPDQPDLNSIWLSPERGIQNDHLLAGLVGAGLPSIPGTIPGDSEIPEIPGDSGFRGRIPDTDSARIPGTPYSIRDVPRAPRQDGNLTQQLNMVSAMVVSRCLAVLAREEGVGALAVRLGAFGS